MDNQRLIKKVYLWDKQLNNSGVINTWSSEVKDILQRNGQISIYVQEIFNKKPIIKSLTDSLFAKDQSNWKSACLPLPKLRTFNLIKDK